MTKELVPPASSSTAGRWLSAVSLLWKLLLPKKVTWIRPFPLPRRPTSNGGTVLGYKRPALTLTQDNAKVVIPASECPMGLAQAIPATVLWPEVSLCPVLFFLSR